MCKKSKLRLGSYTLKFDFNGTGYTIVKIKGEGADLIIPKEFNDGKHGARNVTAIRRKACGKYRYHNLHHTGDIASWCRITGLYEIKSRYALYVGGTLVEGDLVIPEGVTSIGDYAFYNCKGLTGITIPDSVTSIGWCAFNGCTGLTSITIPDSVTSIGSSAFDGCTGLTSITIPDSVTSIGSYAFKGCTGLTSVSIPNSVTSIGMSAFYGCTRLTSITIPDSVTSIGNRAFYCCTGLTSITIPDSVTSIGWCAFDNTAWYNTQPDGVVYIGKVLYEYKGTMLGGTEIIVKEGTKSITEGAFLERSELISVTIPDSVTNIGRAAFECCIRLVEVYNKSSLGIQKGSDWYGEVGYYAKDIYTNEHTSKLSTDDDGFIMYLDGDIKSLIAYIGRGTDITIPEEVTEINQNAFRWCNGLTSVVIPDSVTSIGSYAFKGCTGLTSVSIPNSVTSIGMSAFYGCTRLTSITIPDSVTSIGKIAFGDCPVLTIFCEAKSKPKGWDNDWNPDNRPVVWGAEMPYDTICK